MNEQLDRKLAPEEVNTLVKALDIDFDASRNRLRVHQEKFENLLKDTSDSNLRNSGIHEESVSWTMLPDNP